MSSEADRTLTHRLVASDPPEPAPTFEMRGTDPRHIAQVCTFERPAGLATRQLETLGERRPDTRQQPPRLTTEHARVEREPLAEHHRICRRAEAPCRAACGHEPETQQEHPEHLGLVTFLAFPHASQDATIAPT